MNLHRNLIVWCASALCVLAAGCSSGSAAGTSTSRETTASTSTSSPAAATTAAPKGPAIRVIWEALAREKELYSESKWRRPGVVAPPQRIVLMSTSHPDATLARASRTQAEREQNAGVAVLSDADMLALMRGLEQRDFFKVARESAGTAGMAGNDDARGLVTVERDGRSWTLISMRGQGQNPATRDVPRVYSQAKQAIMLLRNANPTLSVSNVSRGSVQVR